MVNAGFTEHHGVVQGCLLHERVRRDVDLLAYAGLDLATFTAEVEESVRRAVPSAGASYLTLDPETALPSGWYHNSGVVAGGGSGQTWALLEYGRPEPTSLIQMHRSGTPCVSTHAMTGGRLSTSARMRDLMIPQFGLTDELRALGYAGSHPWGAVLMYRDDGVFGEDEVGFMASLSGALGRGLRHGVLTRPPRGICEGPRGGPPAMLVLSSDAQVVVSSPGAVDRLAELPGGTAPRTGQGLIAALTAAAWHARDTDEPTVSTRVRVASGQWLSLHATALRGANSPELVGVSIEEAHPVREVLPFLVESLGLTDRERDVLALVMLGWDTRAIGSRLHLSAYTVQDHLKAVFGKAGVHSRRELTALLLFDSGAPVMA